MKVAINIGGISKETIIFNLFITQYGDNKVFYEKMDDISLKIDDLKNYEPYTKSLSRYIEHCIIKKMDLVIRPCIEWVLSDDKFFIEAAYMVTKMWDNKADFIEKANENETEFLYVQEVIVKEIILSSFIKETKANPRVCLSDNRNRIKEDDFREQKAEFMKIITMKDKEWNSDLLK